MSDWSIKVCPSCKHDKFTIRQHLRDGTIEMACANCKQLIGQMQRGAPPAPANVQGKPIS